jgi:hypothetical protein
MMLSIISKFWKKKPPEPEITPPAPTVKLHPIYNVKTESNVQKKLIKMRKQIKRMGYDIRISKEELRHIQRAKTPLFDLEEEHVKYLFNVREQRARFIAYGYLRGKRYAQIEDNPHCRKHFKRKKRIVDGKPLIGIDNKPVYQVVEHGPDKEGPNWDRVATIIFQFRMPDQHLLAGEELQQKKAEILTKLRVWVGN